jgi:hypothetical protein
MKRIRSNNSLDNEIPNKKMKMNDIYEILNTINIEDKQKNNKKYIHLVKQDLNRLYGKYMIF